VVFGIIDGITMATKGLLIGLGLFTLALAGVGIMNIIGSSAFRNRLAG
jgi:hypothetical protein